MRNLRQELRRKPGGAFSSVSSLLGAVKTIRRINQTLPCGPSVLMRYWTMRRHHNEFEVEHHEGSLTAKTALGRNMPWRGSKFVPSGTPYMYVEGCI